MGPKFAPPPLSEIPPAVADAVKDNPDTVVQLKLNLPFNFLAWSKESKALAQNTAYRGITENQQPSDTYNEAALKVARQRVAWAGYRLAALLNAIWPETP